MPFLFSQVPPCFLEICLGLNKIKLFLIFLLANNFSLRNTYTPLAFISAEFLIRKYFFMVKEMNKGWNQDIESGDTLKGY